MLSNVTHLQRPGWPARAGANPTTPECTAMYNASVLVGYNIFARRRKYFYFQNALGYSLVL
jgi:hypothetical protein